MLRSLSALDHPPNARGTASEPLCSIRNTATRWLTTVNYDLLISQDKLVVIRGISWRTAGRDLSAGHAAGSQTAAGLMRVEHASAIPEAELLAQHTGNRIVRAGEVKTARLGRRIKIAHMKIRLKNGKRLTYKWLGWPSHYGDYHEIHRHWRIS